MVNQRGRKLRSPSALFIDNRTPPRAASDTANQPTARASALLLACSAEGYGYSDKENVCFACSEGCASCTETSCSYCRSGWAFADNTEKSCTKARRGSVGWVWGQGLAWERQRWKLDGWSACAAFYGRHLCALSV